jgi:probable phosphoglycerate mutase
MSHTLDLWLVRHGQTDGNENGRLVGWKNTPLTALGQAQARKLKPVLSDEPFAGVWSSDLIRAVTTARLSYGEPTLDERLREIHFGDLEEKKWDQVEPKYRDALMAFDDFEAPNGETLAGVRTRLLDFVSSLSDGRHLIFTHGGVIRILTQDLGIRRFVPNGTLVVVRWTQKKVLFTNPPRDAWS